MTDAAVPNKEADLNSRNGVPIDDWHATSQFPAVSRTWAEEKIGAQRWGMRHPHFKQIIVVCEILVTRRGKTFVFLISTSEGCVIEIGVCGTRSTCHSHSHWTRNSVFMCIDSWNARVEYTLLHSSSQLTVHQQVVLKTTSAKWHMPT
jgi:hypothetical protein